MEDRIVAAAAIGLVTLVAAGWLALRKIADRRRFKERQMGRGKNGETMPVD
jgi:hypothetical protein